MKFLVEQQPVHVATGGFSDSDQFKPGQPTVVFIHGAANDNTVWSSLLRQLTGKPELKGVNLLAPDLPGHGETFSVAKTRIEDYADWLINLLDNGAIPSATLVGHSMGSLIALDCARRYPSRVDKLMLIGAALPMPVSDVLMQAAEARPDEAFDMLTRWSHWVTKNADGTFPPPTAGMQKDRAMLARSRPGALANDLAACTRYQLDEAAFAAITTPTFILASEHDKMTSAAAAASLCERLPNAILTMLSGVGHAMMQQAPIDVANWGTTSITAGQ
jgi:pimeloyl-ACP methyl ester carboxylesterase